jgi:hypothetical protein
VVPGGPAGLLFAGPGEGGTLGCGCPGRRRAGPGSVASGKPGASRDRSRPRGLPVGCSLSLTEGDDGGSPCACAACASCVCVWTSVLPSVPPCRLGSRARVGPDLTPLVPGSRPLSPHGGPLYLTGQGPGEYYQWVVHPPVAVVFTGTGPRSLTNRMDAVYELSRTALVRPKARVPGRGRTYTDFDDTIPLLATHL